MPDRAFLDTNVLVYAHDQQAPDKRRLAQELIFEALRTRNSCVSAQVLSEFYVTVTRKIKRPLSEALAMREVALLSHLDVVDLDFTLVLRAIELGQRWKLNHWDAMIVAAAERGNCAFVLSEDMSDGLSIGGVTVRNPFR
jgi:predicted nucleic acid-binding protein